MERDIYTTKYPGYVIQLKRWTAVCVVLAIVFALLGFLAAVIFIEDLTLYGVREKSYVFAFLYIASGPACFGVLAAVLHVIRQQLEQILWDMEELRKKNAEAMKED